MRFDVLAAAPSHRCFADDDNYFHVTLDPYASETGYYKFDECGDTPMPVLAMERGVTYTFGQSDASNWYHPLGFAYYPDGAHKDVDELEPGISQSGSTCVGDNTCQAPMYYKNGAYVGGDYDNVAGAGGEDFGLDAYEPEFFFERADWIDAGTYEVKLTLTDEAYDGDLFYFCHIHNWMSGRIKVWADGAVVQVEDSPELGYDYEVPSDYDASCGTYGVGDYTRDSGMCDGPFICTEGDETDAQQAFGECLYAMDCHMNYNMRTILSDADPIVTFIHQMIPHHQNAVNMAKAMLATDTLDADDEDDAGMIDMLWGIINVQNFQIHNMEAYLDGGGYDATAHCSGDSGAWYKKDAPHKDCAWVAKFLPTRCGVKGWDKSTACDSCADTCAGSC